MSTPSSWRRAAAARVADVFAAPQKLQRTESAIDDTSIAVLLGATKASDRGTSSEGSAGTQGGGALSVSQKKLRRKLELTSADDESDRRGQKDFVSARRTGDRKTSSEQHSLPTAIFKLSPGLTRAVLRF